MVLADTYASALALLAFSIFCFGSWANAQKRAGGRWRFELLYYDFAAGSLLCAVVAAFTLGSLNSKELTFEDNLLITGYRNMAYAFGAGMAFNLGNMLLAGAVAVSGMAIVFPIGLGMAAATAAVFNYVLNPQGNGAILFSGVASVLVGIFSISAAYTAHIEARRVAANKAAAADPSAGPRRRLPRAGRAIVLSTLGGLVTGFSYPLLTAGAWAEPAIGPYGTAVMFAAGVLMSTLLYNPFFMHFPVQGRPVEFKTYFKGAKREHWLGLLGGAIWMAGILSTFVVVNSMGGAGLGAVVIFIAAQAGLFVAMLWGWLAWRDFEGARGRVPVLIIATVIFFAAGLSGMVIAPTYGR